jgi:hypothetical protein
MKVSRNVQERVDIMAYQVPASHQSIGQDKFTFGPVSGDEFAVRRMGLLTVGKLEALEDSATAIEFFGAKGTPQGDYIRSLTRDQFQELVGAWRSDSGVTAGESPASDS